MANNRVKYVTDRQNWFTIDLGKEEMFILGYSTTVREWCIELEIVDGLPGVYDALRVYGTKDEGGKLETVLVTRNHCRLYINGKELHLYNPTDNRVTVNYRFP